MNRLIAVMSFVLIAAGCSSDLPVSVTVLERVADVEKTVARIGVDGMMCEIACGGKIRKELSELKGVASASVQFNDQETVNYALVEYNPSLVNERQLIETINRISDGRLYSVTDVVITHYTPSGSLSTATGSDGVNMHLPEVVIPGIVDVLWSLIGGFRR